MTLDISVDLSDVKIIPSSELEEIAQNVQTILATEKFSVPLDRAFGLDGAALDRPLGAAQARLTADIATAVNQFEPRARVQRVTYDGDYSDGVLKPTVRIEVVEEKLRGYVRR